MATITNDATATYVFDGSSDVETINSNLNSLSLEDAQGLTVTKTASPTTFIAGDIITYTVTITNSSSSFLNGVRIIDNIGGGNLAYVIGSARLTVGSNTYAVTPVATNPLTFALQQLSVGATMTLTYRSQVIFNLPSSVNSITNTVQAIGYTSTGTVLGFANTTIQKKTNVDFALTKTSSSTNVFRNQPFSYFLTLSNNSNVSATALSLVDELPSNFVITSVTLKIGSGATTTLSATDYNISGSTITIPSASGPTITVPAGGTTVVTINGYFN